MTQYSLGVKPGEKIASLEQNDAKLVRRDRNKKGKRGTEIKYY